MKNLIIFIIVPTLALVYFTGCMPTVTKVQKFPGMYEEKPKSLLIIPPIDESNTVDAKDYYTSTIEVPLAVNGYYVLPYEVTSDLLKQDDTYNIKDLNSLPLNKFYDDFGADAVLFTKIKRWDTSYMVLASSLTVSIDAEIISTHTSKVLWKYNGTEVVELGSAGGGIAGLVAAVVTAVAMSSSDYTVHSSRANEKFVKSLPYGSYHPSYLKDQGVQIIDQTAKK